jgi:hypothetical protein
MWISAALAAIGGVLAFITLAGDRAALTATGTRAARPSFLGHGSNHLFCPLEAPPLTHCPGSTSSTTKTGRS